MNSRSARTTLKQVLPLPIRRTLRAVLHYVQRLGRWMVDGVGDLALMKMDLEGAELPALRGVADAMAKLQAAIYESSGTRRSEDGVVGRMLMESGFWVGQIDGNNWLACRESA